MKDTEQSAADLAIPEPREGTWVCASACAIAPGA